MKFCLFFLFFAIPIFAQTQNFAFDGVNFAKQAQIDRAGDSVEFALSSPAESISAGETFSIFANFKIPQNSHIYSNAENQNALPTKIKLFVPSGFEVVEERWQNPIKKEEAENVFLVYENSLEVVFKIKAPKKIEAQNVKISADANWLECSDICKPNSAKSKILLQVKSPESTNTASESLGNLPSANGLNQAEESGFVLALFGAFLGGIILNLMPCVFPVISLKILSFAKNSDFKGSLKNALFYSLGIIISFVGLAILLVWLKSLGSELGWGFQLQQPKFVALLVLLFVAIALSLMGVFEVGSNFAGLAGIKKSNGYFGSFLSGVLAVVVASPCTAPFMASALGFALLGNISALSSVAIFTSLGVGMALPYCILCAFPKLRAILPKSGSWMLAFKQFMAFPMFATAIWLAGIFAKETSSESLVRLIFAVLILAFGLWIFGKFSQPIKSRKTRIFAKIALMIFVILSVFLALNFSKVSSAKISENDWSQERVAKLQKEGKIVFVDFTASWCLTCQTNKLAVLNTQKIQKFFKENDVVILTADWTNQNPKIKRELEKFGRAGVPLCLVYPPNPQNPPIVLPAILTQNSVIDAVLSCNEKKIQN